LAERAMNARLQGGCQVPIAGHAEITNGVLALRGLVGAPDGSEIIEANATGPSKNAEALGEEVAEQLLQHGAARILRELYNQA